MFAHLADQLLVRLRSPLQLVDGILKLVNQLVREVRLAGGETRGLEVGDGTDAVTPRHHRHLGQVPPGALLFLEFILGIELLLLISKAVLDEPWEAVTFDHTDLVEVVIASISFGGFRMQREGPLQTKLLVEEIKDLGLGQRTTAILQVHTQQADRLLSRKVFEGKQIFFHPDWVAYQKALAAPQWCNGLVLRNPIRTRKDFPIV